MAWPTRSRTTVYENPWIEVVEDRVEKPDGTEGIYGVVELRHEAVFVVALTDANEVALVTIDRHTTGTSVEVPAGGSDGEDLLVAARRELLEETGFEAASWQTIGRVNALNGICRATETIFLARGLTRAVDDDAAREEEGISQVRLVPFAEVLGMVRSGEISDGETVAALMLAALELGRVA